MPSYLASEDGLGLGLVVGLDNQDHLIVALGWDFYKREALITKKRRVWLGPREDRGRGSLHQQDGKVWVELSAVRGVNRSLKKLEDTVGHRFWGKNC